MTCVPNCQWRGSLVIAFVGGLATGLIILAPATAQADSAATKVPMRERIAILRQTYPDLIYSVTNKTLRLMSNQTVVVDDGRRKSHLQKRRHADIEDQLSQVYPVERCYRGRRRDIDPGLIRSARFLKLAYGANRHQVQRTSEVINWFGTEVTFSGRHGAARALRRVRNELRKLPPKLQKVLRSPKRVFDWRNVVETDRLDVHSFGIAIDLDAGAGTNWRRAGAKIGRLRRYRNRVPPRIVLIFEKHGFIWGGKWYRFETNHFEYRPELIAIGKLALERGCEPKPKAVSWKSKAKPDAKAKQSPRGQRRR